MFALYKLQAKIFLKGPTLIFLIVSSIIYLLVFGSIVKYSGLSPDQQQVSLLLVFGSVTAISLMNIALNTFGYSFFDMKNSVLIKRIGATNLTKIDVLTGFILWGITTVFIALGIMLFLMAFFSSWTGYFAIFDFGAINWVGLIVGTFIGSAAMFSVALLLISVSPSTQIYQIYSFLYFFIFAAFGGLFTPTNTPHWMEIVGWFSPITWTSEFITNSALGADVFHVGGYAISQVGNTPIADPITVNTANATLDLFMPIIYIVLFLGLTTKTFKWDS
ncbi:MAG: hypothetical protein HPAVJP_1110 [Candidatus Hepatoplasma vulgare]|nr:MAG: hypothetical protein HPAVJP_1110 [Candidatus Hepatoplasma sp.]